MACGRQRKRGQVFSGQGQRSGVPADDGELYQAVIMSQKQFERDFGWHSLEIMRKTCAMVDFSDAAEETSCHYRSLREYFKENGTSSGSGRSPQPLDTDVEVLLKNLESHPAKSRGLTLTHEFDLGKDPIDLLKVLEWAIKWSSTELRVRAHGQCKF